MIEEIEKLETDTKRGILPVRNLGLLHDREIGIEVARPAILQSSKRPL